MQQTVRLQILLSRPWRTADGVGRVRELLKSLGIKPTAEGSATISAEMSRDDFEATFKTQALEVDARPPGDQDFGRSGGHVGGDLAIPEPLREYVESISVASPYLRM